MDKYICSTCGQEYYSPKGHVPPGINWSDGHKCTPVLDKFSGLGKSLIYNHNDPHDNEHKQKDN